MPGTDFKEGERVEFVNMPNGSVTCGTYRPGDLVTVLAVSNEKTDDGAPMQHVQVSGGAWVYGWALRRAGEPAKQADIMELVVSSLEKTAHGFSAVAVLLDGFLLRLENIERLLAKPTPTPHTAEPEFGFEVTSPGLYLMRNGQTAKVLRGGGRGVKYPWVGEVDIAGEPHGICWTRTGFYRLGDGSHAYNLVKRLGDLP